MWIPRKWHTPSFICTGTTPAVHRQLLSGLKNILPMGFSYSRQFYGAAAPTPPGQVHMCCLHGTQFHIKLPPHLTNTTHMLSPIWLRLDFSICKTPGKHVRLRWKARCLQAGKETRYLSCQLKWTRQMYFWLKLKLWALSGYPGDAARCTACVWQRGIPWSFEPGCGFQQFTTGELIPRACLRGGASKYWIHRSRLIKVV